MTDRLIGKLFPERGASGHTNGKAPDGAVRGGANHRDEAGVHKMKATTNVMDAQGTEPIGVSKRDAWIAKRLLCGKHEPADTEAASEAFRPVAERVAALPLDERSSVFYQWLDHQADDFTEGFQAAMRTANPEGQPPADEPEIGTTEGEGIGEPPWPKPIEGAGLMGLAGEVVRAIDPNTEADPAAVLVQFLVAFGNMIGAVGHNPWFHVDGHFHHANLFGVIVGDTARARKGTSWRRCKRVLSEADPVWSGERILSGLSSGEGLIWAVRDPIHGVDKKTGEAITVDFGIEDKRLLVVENEFGGVLRVLGRDGNLLSSILRQAFDGDALRTMTKNNPACAAIAHVSIAGHITREELAKYLSLTEAFNGLANRFLWVAAKRSKLLPFGGGRDDGDAAILGEATAKAAEIAKAREQKDSGMRWSPAGRRAWGDVYGELTADRPGLLGVVTCRAEALALRLAMVYALLDGTLEIGREHLEAALEVWRYCFESARLIFGRVESTGDRTANKILAALKESPAGLTKTEIVRDVFQKNAKPGDIDRALIVLINAGFAKRESVATGGRPADRFRAA